MTQNRKQFGMPLEVRSKTTRHFFKDCEVESWMVGWITRIETNQQALLRYYLDTHGLAIDDGIRCLKTVVNCEACSYVRVSSRDALSEINSRRPTDAD